MHSQILTLDSCIEVLENFIAKPNPNSIPSSRKPPSTSPTPKTPTLTTTTTTLTTTTSLSSNTPSSSPHSATPELNSSQSETLPTEIAPNAGPLQTVSMTNDVTWDKCWSWASSGSRIKEIEFHGKLQQVRVQNFYCSSRDKTCCEARKVTYTSPDNSDKKLEVRYEKTHNHFPVRTSDGVAVVQGHRSARNLDEASKNYFKDLFEKNVSVLSAFETRPEQFKSVRKSALETYYKRVKEKEYLRDCRITLFCYF